MQATNRGNSNDEAGVQLLKYKDAAVKLVTCERTVYSLVKKGKLKAVRFGGSVRIDPRDLDAFIQASKAA